MATKVRVGIKPLHDKILVERDEPEQTTAAGIIIPESGKERPKTGTVVAVGDGALNTETGERIPLTIKEGQRVIFTSYAGTEVKFGDDEYLIMSEDDILATVD
ncbi:MAG TPA: co-chaperone GroES [Phycisphaerales bacterium]|nr:co-chaperone GroES [Phycisphaerales bacterium]